jgi:DNA-binding CsgD family transcriptional regulator
MDKQKLPQLTRRRRETLELLLSGLSEKEVGIRLGITQNTVHSHVFQVYRHYGVSSRGELLARFLNAILRAKLKSAPRRRRGERPGKGGEKSRLTDHWISTCQRTIS